jgi:hypothetical protein
MSGPETVAEPQERPEDPEMEALEDQLAVLYQEVEDMWIAYLEFCKQEFSQATRNYPKINEMSYEYAQKLDELNQLRQQLRRWQTLRN